MGTRSEVIENWTRECGGEISIARHDATDPAAPVRAALSAMPAQRRDLVAQALAALIDLPADELELEAEMLQRRAARATAAQVREPAAARMTGR